MKWSALASLFAAPLALAGTLQADVVARTDKKGSKDMSYGESYGNGESYGSGSTTVIVEEVVLIWVCMGGGSSTTTMSSVTNTMGSAMMTHTVSSLSSPYVSILR
jgi:hypothetical protein